MNILLTNDDGYDSKGILLLKKLLSKYGNVVVVAPDGPRSGFSASLTLGRAIKLEPVEENVYKCSGSPADCVSMGCCIFNIDFDLVVSGCNDGWNISYDTMYSGTIGAAQEALIFGIPSIAFSAKHNSSLEEVEQYFDKVFEFILKNELLSKEYVLNINFPRDEVKGMEIANLYYRKDQNYFTNDEDGYYAYRNMQTDYSDDPHSDCYLADHGIISIVPLSKTYFQKELKDKLIDRIK